VNEDLKYYKPFVQLVDDIGRRHGNDRVFTDFLTMATCAYHPQTLRSPGLDPDPDNEQLYLDVIKPYKRPELDKLAELLALVQLQAREYPFSDLLGAYFEQHVTRGQNGQFFTPVNLCQMMARMTYGDVGAGKTIADPACGSGRMLLAVAEDAPANLFFAADVDARCCRMAALNFFANGLRGEVAWMNSLTLQWWGAWHVNDAGATGIQPVPQAKSWMAAPFPANEPRPAAAPAPVLVADPIPRRPPGEKGQLAPQLSLF
jgi:N-6 DNA Methylase